MSDDKKDERLFCRKCGTELLGDSEFCHKCGTKVIILENKCQFCGHKLLDNAIFCNKCGKRVVTEENFQPSVETKEQKQPESNIGKTPIEKDKAKKVKSRFNTKAVIGILIAIGALCLVIGIPIICLINGKETPSSSSNASGSQEKSDEDSNWNDTTTNNISSEDEDLTQVSVSNGQMIISPSYKGVCPFEVQTSGTQNYYIYLEYIGEPASSLVSREKINNVLADSDDIAFYVAGGQTVVKEIPIGDYKLYYAVGNIYYGPDDLFGSTTEYYEADDIFSFYATGNYYEGNTVTLYPVVDGNLSTLNISESAFPGN